LELFGKYLGKYLSVEIWPRAKKSPKEKIYILRNRVPKLKVDAKITIVQKIKTKYSLIKFQYIKKSWGPQRGSWICDEIQ